MSQPYVILITMISICCSLPKPDYQELAPDERKVFCKLVYLLWGQ